MFENLDNDDRCPVTTYLAYTQHRPPEIIADDSPFYLAVNTEVRKAGKKWFKAAQLGVNSLISMVKKMFTASQVHSDNKLVNHSTRKHLIQKLVDTNISPNEIVQITGHKSINSLITTPLYLTEDSSTARRYEFFFFVVKTVLFCHSKITFLSLWHRVISSMNVVLKQAKM